jgi:hypothetical protein
MRNTAPPPAGSASNTIEIIRLNPHDRHAILHATAEVAGPVARAWLFGSRADDRTRGAQSVLVTR